MTVSPALLAELDDATTDRLAEQLAPRLADRLAHVLPARRTMPDLRLVATRDLVDELKRRGSSAPREPKRPLTSR